MKKQPRAHDIAYVEAVHRLLQYIPEIMSAYNLELENWRREELPSHIAYGSVFSDFLRRIVTQGTSEPS